VATASNAASSLRSGRPFSAVPHFRRSLQRMRLQSTICLVLAIFCSACGETSSSKEEGLTIPNRDFGKGNGDEHPPGTKIEELPSAGEVLEAYALPRRRYVLRSELILYGEDGNVVAHLKPGLVIQSPSLDDVPDTDIGDNDRVQVLFDIPNEVQWELLEKKDKPRWRRTWYRHKALLSADAKDSEQDGAEQPAARSESR